MREIAQIRDALLRLSCIGRKQFHYDPVDHVFGDGEIHYLVEVAGMFFMAWEDNDTGMMIVNSITRLSFDELSELGAAETWAVLHVPLELSEGIQFREIDDAELSDAYSRMERQSLGSLLSRQAGTLSLIVLHLLATSANCWPRVKVLTKW